MREKHNLLRGTVLGFGVLLAAASFFTAVKLNAESPSPKTSEVTKSAGALWHENFEEAAALAKREKKPMLLYFTGSDWCGWCKKLHAEVLDRPEFTKWAAENVIPVKLDFPRRKEQSEEIKKQNEPQHEDSSSSVEVADVMLPQMIKDLHTIMVSNDPFQSDFDSSEPFALSEVLPH